jgi:crotonobetainyl-CoA:carnitine CoA-transferase CaiB-like acyl-CoA transferase
MALALENTKVLTVEEKLPVTYCSMLLGDLGADVIIVEQPGVGNPARVLPHFLEITNRNKRSITVNLKSERGKKVFYRLAKNCDVIIECMRPGVVKRLGIGYETIRSINPGIVYCSVSGYGQDGPYWDWPAHDLSYQGIAGMLDLAPRDGEGIPQPSGVAIADLSAGMFAAISILSALLARDRLGFGQYIDVSMTDGLVSWLSVELGQYFAASMLPRQGGRGFEAATGVFVIKDGKYLTLSIAHENYFWSNLCHAIGQAELADMPREQRWQRRDELRVTLKKALLSKTRDEWIKILTEADVPCGPVLSLKEVVCDAHLRHRGMFPEVEKTNGEKVKQVAYPAKFSETQPQIRRLPPALGEHTREILVWLGYAPEEIEELRQKGDV